MHTARLLVADDNPVSLQYLAEAAGSLGFHCHTAADGTAALAAARATPFDLLLLDARMPGRDGADVLVALRVEAGPSRYAAAIATTAEPAPAMHARLLQAGFSAVLVKPLALGQLREALLPYLEASSAPTEPVLDDAQALAAAGGDRRIVAVLRGLFVAELDTLPVELAAIAARRDIAALRERLHRFRASAGFCGTPTLQGAATALHRALDEQPGWPEIAQANFLAHCARVRALLADA